MSFARAAAHDDVVYSLAVLVPFVDEQLDRLTEMVTRWRAYPPCVDEVLPATLFLYHPTNSTRFRSEEVLGLLGEHSRCFSGGVQLLDAHLPEELAFRHPEGTCEQFYKAFQLLRGRVDYFYLMEPDALPVRSRWLARLVAEVQHPPCQSFWVKGSVSHCDGRYGELRNRLDLHINGGALYCVGDPALEALFERVKRFYPSYFEAPVYSAGCALGGFDHSIYQFLHHRSNFDYARTVLHLYQYTDALYNLCEDGYDEAELRRRVPGVQIVHSKAPWFDAADRQVRQVYQEILRRFPTKKTEQRLWADRLRAAGVPNLSTAAKGGDSAAITAAVVATTKAREDMLDQMARTLCCSAAYWSRMETGRPSERCTALCASNYRGMRRGCARACKPAHARIAWELRLPAPRPYVWTNDLHVGPMACSEPLLESLGARVHSEIDFNNCVWHPHMCRRRLKVLTFDSWRGFSLDPCPNAMRRAWFEAYKNDEEMRRVDLFVCSHPAANCELFLPFQRAVLVYATTRLEFGRNDKHVAWRAPYIGRQSGPRWAEWVANLRRIAEREGNVVAANNMFDVRYIKYHTGLDAMYLPSWCEPSVVYQPMDGMPYLLGPYRDNLGGELVNGTDVAAWSHPLFKGLSEALRGTPIQMRRMRELYGGSYSWRHVVRHPAIVYIPYQVSTMSFFEFYRMNIPIFVPTAELLTEWVFTHGVMWERIYGAPERLYNVSSEPDSPNDNRSLWYWLQQCDYYVFPHVQVTV